MLTINLTQLGRKKLKDGRIPIYLRITENRKSRYKATGIAVSPKHWNTTRQRISRSHREYKRLNAELEGMLIQVQTKKFDLAKDDKLSLQRLTSGIDEHKDTFPILTKATEYRAYLQANNQYWEQRHFGIIIGDLTGFISTGASGKVEKMDTGWMEGFQKYLVTKNSPVTLNKKMQRLRGMTRWLLKKEELEKDPFLTIKRVEEAKGDSKVKLSLEQIRAMESLDLAEYSDLWHTRNYFLYSFYNAGIRFGDLCTLQWSNLVDGRLTYRMHKTGGTKSIKQLEPMHKILQYYRNGREKPDDYIFPLLERPYHDPMELRRRVSSLNVMTNRRLKQVGGLAGIQANISFHVSRHSFAHLALSGGMDLYSVSKALGHSDLKTTQIYIKSFDEDLLDKSMNALFKKAEDD